MIGRIVHVATAGLILVTSMAAVGQERPNCAEALPDLGVCFEESELGLVNVFFQAGGESVLVEKIPLGEPQNFFVVLPDGRERFHATDKDVQLKYTSSGGLMSNGDNASIIAMITGDFSGGVGLPNGCPSTVNISGRVFGDAGILQVEASFLSRENPKDDTCIVIFADIDTEPM